MFRVSEEVRFVYGHRLLDYDGKCAYLHGHNARVELILAAKELDRRGFVVDFGDVKAAACELVEARFDHKMLLRDDDPIIPVLREAGELFVTLPVNPSAENLARLIFDHLQERGFPITAVRFYETDTSIATYEP